MVSRRPRRPALPLALAALAACVCGPLFPPFLWTLCLGAALLALARALARRGPLSGGVIACLLATAALFGLDASLQERAARACRSALHHSGEPPAILRGRVVAGPRPGRGGNAWVLASGDVRVELWVPGRAASGPLLGARLAASGRFAPLAIPAGGYDKGERLARVGVSRRFRASALRVLEPPGGWRAWLGQVRTGLRLAIQRSAPEQAELLRAIVLGERVPLPAERRDAFAATGSAHLLSISGLHVSLLALLVMGALRLFGLDPARQRLLALGALLAYLVLVGPRVPLLRALTAGALCFLAPTRGDAWQRLALALLATLCWDPLAPRDLGCQLSFGTVAAMLALGQALLRRGRKPGWGRRAAGGLAAALCASTPLLSVRCGQLPLVGPLLALPLGLLFGALLGATLLGLGLGAFVPPAEQLLLGLAAQLGLLLEGLVLAAGQLPGATARLLLPSGAATALAGGLLAWGALRREAGRRARAPLALGLLLALACVLPRPSRPATALELNTRGRNLALRVPGQREAFVLHQGERLAREGLGARRSATLAAHDGLRVLRLPGGSLLLSSSAGRLLLAGHRWPRALEVLPPAALRAQVLVERWRLSPAAHRRLLRAVRPARRLPRTGGRLRLNPGDAGLSSDYSGVR